MDFESKETSIVANGSLSVAKGSLAFLTAFLFAVVPKSKSFPTDDPVDDDVPKSKGSLAFLATSLFVVVPKSKSLPTDDPVDADVPKSKGSLVSEELKEISIALDGSADIDVPKEFVEF